MNLEILELLDSEVNPTGWIVPFENNILQAKLDILDETGFWAFRIDDPDPQAFAEWDEQHQEVCKQIGGGL